MKTFLQSCFRFGIILTIAGFGVAFFLQLADLMLAFVLLALAAVYLGWSVWTANKSSGYDHPKQCFGDIMGDITAYPLLMVALFVWLVLPRYMQLPFRDEQYWILTAFLGVMIAVTLVELVITVHTCLIAMWRQNPVTITR